MNSRVLSYISMVVCLVLGTLLIAIDTTLANRPSSPRKRAFGTSPTPSISSRSKKGASLYIYIPYDTPHCEVRVGKPTHLGLRSEHPRQPYCCYGTATRAVRTISRPI